MIVNKNPAWSYSRLNNFENCPKQFYHLNVAKDVKQPESPDQKYGNQLHKAIELRVNKGKPLGKQFAFMEPVVQKFLSISGEKHAELQIAVDTDMQLVDWFDAKTWARAIVDLAIINEHRAAIVDWKTGKKISDDFSQQQAAAALMFIKFPQLEEIEMIYFWTAHMKPTSRTILKKDIRHVWSVLLRRIRAYKQAHIDINFAPKPSGLCKRHCPVVQCPHNGGHV